MNLIANLLFDCTFAGLRDGLFMLSLATLSLIAGHYMLSKEHETWQK